VRPAALFVVLAAAKAAGLWGHHFAWSGWTPIAYLWHDAVVVLAFAALDALLARRERTARALYALLAGYAAVNIPVVRVLSTPLTASMWRATSGTIGDSIVLYATSTNLLLIAMVSALACVAPLCTARVSRARLAAPLALCVAIGPLAAARVDTLGLERNAWTALAASIMPHVSADAGDAEWRSSGFDRTRRDDLSRFRGAAARRSVIVVSLESTAARYLGIYGATPDVMPNLSALARSAIVFDNAYAVYPESIKGLFAVLCSTFPSFDTTAALYAAMPCPSLAASLSRAGYATALFHSGRFRYLGMEAIVRNRGYDRIEDAGDIGGHHNSSFGVDEQATMARLFEWIDRLPPNQPFFVTYLPIAGHHPYDTPQAGPFPDRDEIGRYRNSLHYADAALGSLVRGLEARGRQQSTLWIVYGDHGEAFGQHEGNFGHTFQLYEENVHVPLVVAMPGIIRETVRVQRTVSLLDITATTIDLVAAGSRIVAQGRTMLDDEPRMALFFADYSLALVGLRDGPLKYIYELDSGRDRLFDVTTDPDEQIEVSSTHPAETRRYEEVLRRWSAAQKAALRAATAIKN